MLVTLGKERWILLLTYSNNNRWCGRKLVRNVGVHLQASGIRAEVADLLQRRAQSHACKGGNVKH